MVPIVFGGIMVSYITMMICFAGESFKINRFWEKEIACTHCGKSIKESQRICPYCGRKIM